MMNTKRQFDYFFNLGGNSAIAVLYTETEVKMRKTGNIYYGRVRKQSRVKVILGADYENVVNKQLIRESLPGTPDEMFKAKPRAWGMRVGGTTLVTHKDKIYVEAMILQSLGYEYLVDGKPATAEQTKYINNVLGERAEGVRQPIDKKVVWRDYMLESINAIKLNGTFTDFKAVRAFPGVPTPKKIVSKKRVKGSLVAA